MPTGCSGKSRDLFWFGLFFFDFLACWSKGILYSTTRHLPRFSLQILRCHAKAIRDMFSMNWTKSSDLFQEKVFCWKILFLMHPVRKSWDVSRLMLTHILKSDPECQVNFLYSPCLSNSVKGWLKDFLLRGNGCKFHPDQSQKSVKMTWGRWRAPWKNQGSWSTQVLQAGAVGSGWTDRRMSTENSLKVIFLMRQSRR